MYKEVKLLDIDGNERNVPMKATAATPYRFRQTFHEEIPVSDNKQAIFAAILVEEGVKSLDDDAVLMKATHCMEKAKDKIRRLAFIMAMSAKGEKMDELNFDKYIDWIDGFDSSAFTEEKEDEIWSVYQKSAENSSVAKK